MEEDKNKRDAIYLVVVCFITAVVLSGIWLYNRSSTQKVSKTLSLHPKVNLEIEKVSVKPRENTNKYYIIFYAKAKNLSNTSVEFNDYLKNPCERYKFQTEAARQRCFESKEYQDYFKNLSENDNYYNETANADTNTLTLLTASNETCSSVPSYEINRTYPDLKDAATDDYKPNETKIGTLVFECPQKSGLFTLKYKSASVQINIH